MDKFGIFKLLNSFFNFNGQKEPTTQSDNVGKNLDTADLFSKLLSGINKNSANNTSSTPPQSQTIKKPSPPLQSDMLRTMNSHDQFIKRVKQKHPH